MRVAVSAGVSWLWRRRIGEGPWRDKRYHLFWARRPMQSVRLTSLGSGAKERPGSNAECTCRLGSGSGGEWHETGSGGWVAGWLQLCLCGCGVCGMVSDIDGGL